MTTHFYLSSFNNDMISSIETDQHNFYLGMNQTIGHGSSFCKLAVPYVEGVC